MYTVEGVTHTGKEKGEEQIALPPEGSNKAKELCL